MQDINATLQNFAQDAADWREMALDARLESRGFTADQRHEIHAAVREQLEAEARELINLQDG